VSFLASLTDEARAELRAFIREEIAADRAAYDREPVERWLTAEKAGHHLGISTRAVYERKRTGRIPVGAVRSGNCGPIFRLLFSGLDVSTSRRRRP
jgi:hypothetical protein